MSYHILLTEEGVEALNEEGKVKIEWDLKTGKDPYIAHYGPLDQSFTGAGVPSKYVRCVTWKGRVTNHFRTDGIYRHGKAVMQLETIKQLHKPYGGQENWEPIWQISQEFSIQAPSCEAAMEIYSLVRQGAIMPAENWEQPQRPTMVKIRRALRQLAQTLRLLPAA